MKLRISILALFAAVCLFSACGDDDTVVDPTGDDVLNHDGPNDSGPILAADTYEAAAMFPASMTSSFAGKKITEVTWFMGAAPTNCAIKIYREGAAGQPGTKIYDVDVTSSVVPLTWSRHTLSSPIDIDGTDLWIAVEFVHSADARSMGCDAGPAVTNGDWLFQSSDAQWLTFRDRTNENINWNIRAITE